MENDGEGASGGQPANRTIQVDALTDVQLVEQVPDDDAIGPAPPPLPPKLQARQAQASAEPSRGRAIGLTLVAVALGALLALGVVHFLLPSAAAPASPSTAPPTSIAPVVEAQPPRAVRRVTLDEELVIHAGSPPPTD